MAQHARLAPSSMGCTVKCPGSVQMQEKYPQDDTTIEAMEGEASHWVASSCLESYKDTTSTVRLCCDFIGDISPNGIIVSKEMADGANEYVREVLNFAQKHGALQTMWIEQKVSINRVHPENWGTPDTFIYVGGKKLIKVFDYKYGHRFVGVFENWQIMNYAIGVLDTITGNNGMQDQEIHVSFCIVQPRSYGKGSTVREWTIKATDLRAYSNVMENQCAAALQENPLTTTGAHCRDCSARYACTAAQEAAYNAVEITFEMSSNALGATAMGLELSTLHHAQEALKARITGLEEVALKSIREGHAVPFFSVKETFGRKKWSKPAKEVIELGDIMNVSLTKPTEVITPTQAISAGIDKEVIAAYSEIPKGGLKLIPDNSNELKRMFQK